MSNDIAPFQVGETVVCIDDNVSVTGLVKGNKYEVLAIVKETCGPGWHVGFRLDSSNSQVMPCSCGCHDLPSYGYVFAYDKRFTKIKPNYSDATAEILEKFKPFEGVEVDQPVKIKELETQN